MTEPCEKAEQIDTIGKDVLRLKTICTVIGAVIFLAFSAFEFYSYLLKDSEARADEAQAEIIKEIKGKGEDTEKRVTSLEIAVKGIETKTESIDEKVGRTLEKQDAILEAIKDLKKDE